jgi:enterochelin esterase-like enzyme
MRRYKVSSWTSCAALFFLTLLLALSIARAQERGNVGRSVISPEVSADHKITFRLQAPNAKTVQVAGDFSGDTFDMNKDYKGVWSYTTDALKPSSYQYWFIMDGLTMPDPLNTYVRPASGVYKSQVEVPGEETKFMAFRDVPHGVLNEHLYINKENGTARRVVIYTPPGYGSSDKPYPVLYLLHGANDFERGWTQTGRANLIMDNLIADGKVVPAIMVMPFGHEISGATGKLPEVRAVQEMLGVTPVTGVPGIRGGGGPPLAGGGGPAPGGAAANAPGAAGARGGAFGGAGYMGRDLLGNVIPLVEKEYRAIKDSKHRAIAGYSMGAGHSSTIGLNHPELFSYVGIFSGAAGENAISKALADSAKTNQDYKLIWIGCGTDDRAITGCRNLDQLLTSKDIKHEFTESPGYRHDYQIWRIYLATVLQKLFRD